MTTTLKLSGSQYTSIYGKLLILKLCLLTFVLALGFPSYAQFSLAQFDISNPEMWYDNSIGRDQSGYLIGEFEALERSSKNTHQFFGNGYWNSSKIHIRGQEYDSVMMLYDISKDLLLLRHPTNLKFHNSGIVPIQEDISWFIVDDHLFKYYPESLSKRPSGFYDQMYSGESVKLLVKRTKVLKIETEANYDEGNTYYLLANGSMHRIYRKRSFYQVFPEHKSAISSFIKQNSLSVSVKNESSLIVLTRFCNELLTNNSNSQ